MSYSAKVHSLYKKDTEPEKKKKKIWKRVNKNKTQQVKKLKLSRIDG